MTGVEFDKIVDRKVSSSYTGFYDKVQRKPALYKESLIKAIESVYDKWDSQSDTDKLLFLIGEYPIALAASSYTVSNIPLYNHLLAVKFKCQDYGFSFSGATLQSNVSPNRLTFQYPNQLRDKEIVNINSVDYYVKRDTSLRYLLYADPGLITPTSADNKTLTSPKRYVYYYAKQWRFDTMIGQYGNPTIYLPKWTMVDGEIKAFPDAAHATFYYVKTLPVNIDPNDNALDLEVYYPYDLLIDAANIAADQISLEKRNYSQYGARSNELQQGSAATII